MRFQRSEIAADDQHSNLGLAIPQQARELRNRAPLGIEVLRLVAPSLRVGFRLIAEFRWVAICVNAPCPRSRHEAGIGLARAMPRLAFQGCRPLDVGWRYLGGASRGENEASQQAEGT